MRKNILLFLPLAAAIAVTAGADSNGLSSAPLAITASSTNGVEKASYRKDRVIVKMKMPNGIKNSIQKAGAIEGGFQKAATQTGLTFEKTLAIDMPSEDESAYAVMKLDATTDTVESAIARLSQQANVEYAQPDFIYHVSAVPNDPNYGSLWGLKNTAQTIASAHLTQSVYTTSNPGTASRDMDLETAWNTLTDCSSVVVAVIDTGVKLDHTDLVDNLWTNGSMEHGYDFVNTDNDPTDDQGHGTHVAGTIGARGNNGIGVTGVCWRVQIMAIKVLDSDGSGTSSDIISGINYARTNGAHIINMSLGGTSFDQLTFNAIKAASDAGILTVAAAGNDGRSNGSIPTYPCNYEIANVVCVGAVDQSFGIASFSNYSTTYVDIGAPGTNILSTAFTAYGAAINLPLSAMAWSLSGDVGFNGGFMNIPSAWDGSTVKYFDNSTLEAYTTVDMSGTTGGILQISLRGESQANADYLSIYQNQAGGDPNATGTRLARISGSTSGAFTTANLDMLGSTGLATCTLGFKFTSDAATTKIGWRIQSLNIDPLIASTSALDSYNGTSMATPHIAGLAALIKASNSAFTAADIKNAIILTGTTVTSLASKFKYGSVANAPNALKYVDAPSGVSAVVVP